MSCVADHFQFVVGVDTQAATHTYALIESPSSKLLTKVTFPTSPAGLSRAEVWIGRRTGGNVNAVLVSAEGTGSYGAVLAERLAGVGYRVIEAPTPSTKRLRGRGKTSFGLAVEIGDGNRFTGSSIGAYLGLVPSEHSSGGSKSQGSITKTGNTHARRITAKPIEPPVL